MVMFLHCICWTYTLILHIVYIEHVCLHLCNVYIEGICNVYTVKVVSMCTKFLFYLHVLLLVTTLPAHVILGDDYHIVFPVL